MSKEIKVSICDKEITIFLHTGCLSTYPEVSPPHHHYNSEIHIVISGSAEFFINGNRLTLQAGQFILIPKNTFHYRSLVTENTVVLCFETDLDASQEVFSISIDTLNELYKQISPLRNIATASAYLALICSHFIKHELSIADVVDREYILEEFFSKNYNKDIPIAHLAKKLCLSEKQTERIVKKITGNTFRQEISRRRIEAAKLLLKTDSLSLGEIAEMVGYKSYSGFWKAYKTNIQHLPDRHQ